MVGAKETTLLSLLFCLSETAVADPCKIQNALQALFTVEAKQGTIVPAKKVHDLLPYSKLEYEAELLGSGAGGSVYRIIPKKVPNRTFIVKITDLETALNDTIGFEMIKKAIGSDSEVKIVSSKILPLKEAPANAVSIPAVMQVEEVKGRSLFSMFADPAVPKAVKQALEQKYKKFLRRLEDGLEQHYGIFAVRLPAEPYFFQAEKEWKFLGKAAIDAQPEIAIWDIAVRRLFDPVKGDPAIYQKTASISSAQISSWRTTEFEIELMIKSDNIIVTKDYDLYLIDPH